MRTAVLLAFTSVTLLAHCDSSKSSHEQPAGAAVSPGGGGPCTTDDDCPLDSVCTSKVCVRQPNPATFPAPPDAQARMVGTWRFDVSAVRSLPQMKGKTDAEIEKAETEGKQNFMVFRGGQNAVGWAPMQLHWGPSKPAVWRLYEWTPGRRSGAAKGDLFLKIMTGMRETVEYKAVFDGDNRMRLELDLSNGTRTELPYVKE